MKKSDQINELATALCAAQSQYNALIKDATNPFYKSHYADLSAVIEAVRGPLSKNGLSITQSTDIDGTTTIVETTLIHTSGQWIQGRYPLTPSKDKDPQSMGSALSYARRYSLMALLGIAAEDDDGETALGRPTVVKKVEKTEKEPAQQPPKYEKATSHPEYATSKWSETVVNKVKKLQKNGKKAAECLREFIPEYNTKFGTMHKLVTDFATDEQLLKLIEFIENLPPEGL